MSDRLDAQDLELIEQAHESIGGTSQSSAKATLDDVLLRHGQQAPVALRKARNDLEAGQTVIAKQRLQAIIDARTPLKDAGGSCATEGCPHDAPEDAEYCLRCQSRPPVITGRCAPDAFEDAAAAAREGDSREALRAALVGARLLEHTEDGIQTTLAPVCSDCEVPMALVESERVNVEVLADNGRLVGSRVEHIDFGDGNVVHLDGQVCDVAFENGDERTVPTEELTLVEWPENERTPLWMCMFCNLLLVDAGDSIGPESEPPDADAAAPKTETEVE